MPLSPGERIAYIREIATLLDKEEWPEIDLVLRQHKLSTSDSWDGGDKRSYAIQMVDDASDESLKELHSFLTGATSNAVIPGQSPFKSDRLRLFLSHLTSHRDLIGEVGRVLSFYGIDAFVAHDSIEASREWQLVIESGLSNCDAMVAFFHAGFIESKWCDQEIGWVMGRKRPILALAFDVMPHGFVAKFQARTCTNEPTHRLPSVIVNWLVEQRTLHGRLAASLTAAFVDSSSWNRTRELAALMVRITGFTDDHLSQMESAAKNNVDVRDCDINGTLGPTWVSGFAAERRSPRPAASAYERTPDSPF